MSTGTCCRDCWLNLRAVARAAGVSETTVCKGLSGPPRRGQSVADETSAVEAVKVVGEGVPDTVVAGTFVGPTAVLASAFSAWMSASWFVMALRNSGAVT